MAITLRNIKVFQLSKLQIAPWKLSIQDLPKSNFENALKVACFLLSTTHIHSHLFLNVFVAEGEFVAQFKQTVILMPNGPLKITGLPMEEGLYTSELSVSNPESVVSDLVQYNLFIPVYISFI